MFNYNVMKDRLQRFHFKFIVAVIRFVVKIFRKNI